MEWILLFTIRTVSFFAEQLEGNSRYLIQGCINVFNHVTKNITLYNTMQLLPKNSNLEFAGKSGPILP